MQTGNIGKGLFGGAERLQEEQNAPKDGTKLGKDAFLKLLVTQMEHQDPLNPVADTDFIAQLSQYSSLEQLVNISKAVEGLNSNSTKSLLSAVDFIGKKVLSEGSDISKKEGTITKVGYTLSEASAFVAFDVYDKTGSLVHSVVLPAKNAGFYTFEWNGKDFNGNELPDGTYGLSIRAAAENGQPVEVRTQLAGVVKGVLSDKGITVLQLTDGREIRADSVTQVVAQDGEKGTAKSEAGKKETIEGQNG